jgi:hypothetical protein
MVRRGKNNRIIAIIVVIGVAVIGLAKFTNALNDLRKFFGLKKEALQNASVTPAPGEIPIGPFWVTSVADPKHPDGRYFYFDASSIDRSSPNLIKDQHTYRVSKNRDTGFRRAVIFRPAGDTNAHGRFLPTGKAGDWRENESFYLVPKDLGEWNHNEQ